MINEFIVTVISEDQLQARAFDGTSSIVIDVDKNDKVSKVFKNLESGRSDLSKENEKLKKENEKLAKKNSKLEEENKNIKSKVKKIEEYNS